MSTPSEFGDHVRWQRVRIAHRIGRRIRPVLAVPQTITSIHTGCGGHIGTEGDDVDTERAVLDVGATLGGVALTMSQTRART
ncbi:MAG: hypothetical protein MUQ27_12770 [Acidimicrobiia bacterium]|nr:hypothetical protein [Acidimicrobiia bacterium]